MKRYKNTKKRYKVNVFKISIILILSILIISNIAEAEMKKVNGYPNKPVTIVLPFGFGGGGDTFARTLAVPLGKQMGVPIGVINVSGGGYANALVYTMNQPADGYTILSVGSAIMIGYNLKQLPVDLFENFIFLPRIAGEEAQLYVKKDSPFKSFDELRKYAKDSSKRKLKFGGSDAGGSRELDTCQILKLTGMNGIYVPFTKGSAVMQAELLAGRIDVAYDLEAPMKNLISSGDVRMLVTSGDKRKPNYPNVPTFAEFGYNFDLMVVRSAIVRKGTPKERVDYLAEALKRAVDTPEFKVLADVLGFEISYLSPEENTKALLKKKEEYYEVQKELGWIK